MEINGDQLIPKPQQQTWDALNDPEVLKACIPGCESLEKVAENEFSLTMSAKIGPVSAKFKGKITLEDMQPPTAYTLIFEGQGGLAGFAKGKAHVSLAPEDEGTRLSYSAQANVGGKIAQVGSRLIDGVARSMAENFFRAFNARVTADAG